MEKIRIGIAGYGNVGKGVEKAVNAVSDMQLIAIFSRRDPAAFKESSVQILPLNAAETKIDEIDVMILCGGSAADLPEQGPYFASLFNIVDSFDTHAKIPEYLASIDQVAKKTTAVIASGWDPGLFSMIRALSGSILPDGSSYTFWGSGVSQGHSDAIRQIDGVKHAVQYTIPFDDAVNSVRNGERPFLTPRQKHLRKCFVVSLPDADKDKIAEKIKKMPNYFIDYETTVDFIEDDEYFENHTEMPHGGVVLQSGKTGENNHLIEFSLKLDSNPEFTGSIMVAYARAAYRMSKEGLFGAKTVFDVPLAYLSDKDRDSLIKELL